MIVCNDAATTVDVNGVLYGHQSAVQRLAAMMMFNMAQGTLDMVIDNWEEYPNRTAIEQAFQGLNESALETLDDHISTIKEQLEAYLKQARTRCWVSRIDYQQDGKITDVKVHMSIDTSKI